GNFQHVSLIRSGGCSRYAAKRLHRQISILRKAHGAFHQSFFRASIQTQTAEYDATVAHDKDRFSRRPARCSRTRLAIGNTGTDIPAAKFHIAQTEIAFADEMLQQFVATHSLGGEMQDSGSKTGKTLGRLTGSRQLRQ